MRPSFRVKLVLIVAAAVVSGLFATAASSVIGIRQGRELAELQHRLVPRLELGSKLTAEFGALRRSMRDAVTAQDMPSLAASGQIKESILARVREHRATLDQDVAKQLEQAVDAYYELGQEVSRRLIQGETGERIVDDMASMQARQKRVEDLVARDVALNRERLSQAFATLHATNQRADSFRLTAGLLGLALVLGLSFWFSRSLLGSLQHFSAGFARFATGDFAEPISEQASADLGNLAREANEMARSLDEAAKERAHRDWLKTTQAALSDEMRGALTPEESGRRVLRLLGNELRAVSGALYLADLQGSLKLKSHFAGAYATDNGDDPEQPNAPAPRVSFKVGEGLVGHAALEQEIKVVHNLPDGYVKVISGVGEASPMALVLVPLAREGRPVGVLEFALFGECDEEMLELLRSVQETMTLAFETSQSRATLESLLVETRQQADRLLAQEEELRVSNQDLNAQQEELRAANEQLVAQRKELRQQNADLAEAKSRLEEQAAELSRVSTYKSRFLANMSHELRTPLNSMLLLSHLLSQNEGHHLTPKQVEHCKTIHAAGEDLLQLITQILDLAKIEAGRQDVNWQVVPVEHFAQYARRRFQELALERGLELEVQVADDAPAEITTDAQRIERILTNLIGNAIKFTLGGSVSFRIERPSAAVRFTRGDLSADNALAFVVKDTGIGIAPELQEKVFVPFEQIEVESARRYGGTGLGLAIARESALLLGGEVQLSSVPGEGSTFTLYVPQLQTDRPDTQGRPAAAPERSKDASWGVGNGKTPQRLLVIEDDAVLAEQLLDIIRARGLVGVVARTGRQGLRMAQTGGVIGIVLDVRLPDIDGWTVMDRLRQDARTREIPVHFVTAVESPARGLALGAVGYLVKPVSHADLSNVVVTLAGSPSGSRASVLVVEDDKVEGESIAAVLESEPVDLTLVRSAEGALQALEHQSFGCMILDLGLPDMDGLTFLEKVAHDTKEVPPRVVIHTGRALSKAETRQLEAYASAVILKDERSGERLVEEVRCFLRYLKEGSARGGLEEPVASSNHHGVSLVDVKILVAEDDMRTVYALSALLQGKGAEVIVAENGREALDLLQRNPDVACVLMDIMMPEMDGYETMRQLRKDARFASTPVIALTARALKGERERCIAAGANDYLMKPPHPETLFQAFDRWLPKQGGAQREP